MKAKVRGGERAPVEIALNFPFGIFITSESITKNPCLPQRASFKFQ